MIQSIFINRHGATFTRTNGEIFNLGFVTLTAIVAVDTVFSIALGVLIGLCF